MQKKRTHIAVIALAASLTMLAACSKEEDTTIVEPAPPATEPAPPVIETPPPTTTPAPTPTPTPDTTPAPGSTTDPTMPPPSSGALDQLKSDAKEAGTVIADKAGEVKDDAVQAARKAGDAIKDGAQRADNAIQKQLTNGAPFHNPDTPPQSGS